MHLQFETTGVLIITPPLKDFRGPDFPALIIIDFSKSDFFRRVYYSKKNSACGGLLLLYFFRRLNLDPPETEFLQNSRFCLKILLNFFRLRRALIILAFSKSKNLGLLLLFSKFLAKILVCYYYSHFNGVLIIYSPV